MTYRLIQGDCRDLMAAGKENAVHAIVTDPPYALTDKEPDITETLTRWLAGEDAEHRSGGFMGQDWDGFVPGPATWREALRVLRPGGHALVFAGDRTVDLMGISLRLAGFEIRGTIEWLYGQGFPKSHNVGVMIDKQAGLERSREDMSGGVPPGSNELVNSDADRATSKNSSESLSPEAAAWEDWGTALKPAHEPIIIARKPLEGKLLKSGKLSTKQTVTVAENILKWGVGAYNLGAWAIEHDEAARDLNRGEREPDGYGHGRMPGRILDKARHPANVIVGHHDACLHLDDCVLCHPECPTRLLDMQTAVKKKGVFFGSSRFFYIPKAGRPERDAGLEEFSAQFAPTMGAGIGGREHNPDAPGALVKNPHPTIKPIDLMRHLVTGIAPAGGVILDPFLGSGTTGIAALQAGFNFIGMERKAEYVQVAAARITHHAPEVTGTVAYSPEPAGDHHVAETEIPEPPIEPAAEDQLPVPGDESVRGNEPLEDLPSIEEMRAQSNLACTYCGVDLGIPWAPEHGDTAYACQTCLDNLAKPPAVAQVDPQADTPPVEAYA